MDILLCMADRVGQGHELILKNYFIIISRSARAHLSRGIFSFNHEHLYQYLFYRHFMKTIHYIQGLFSLYSDLRNRALTINSKLEYCDLKSCLVSYLRFHLILQIVSNQILLISKIINQLPLQFFPLQEERLRHLPRRKQQFDEQLDAIFSDDDLDSDYDPAGMQSASVKSLKKFSPQLIGLRVLKIDYPFLEASFTEEQYPNLKEIVIVANNGLNQTKDLQKNNNLCQLANEENNSRSKNTFIENQYQTKSGFCNDQTKDR